MCIRDSIWAALGPLMRVGRVTAFSKKRGKKRGKFVIDWAHTDGAPGTRGPRGLPGTPTHHPIALDELFPMVYDPGPWDGYDASDGPRG